MQYKFRFTCHFVAVKGFFASVPDIISTDNGGANMDGTLSPAFSVLVFAGHCESHVDTQLPRCPECAAPSVVATMGASDNA